MNAKEYLSIPSPNPVEFLPHVELNPCPFCGGTNLKCFATRVTGEFVNRVDAYVNCTDCNGTMTRGGVRVKDANGDDEKREAVEFWNKRV